MFVLPESFMIYFCHGVCFCVLLYSHISLSIQDINTLAHIYRRTLKSKPYLYAEPTIHLWLFCYSCHISLASYQSTFSSLSIGVKAPFLCFHSASLFASRTPTTETFNPSLSKRICFTNPNSGLAPG